MKNSKKGISLIVLVITIIVIIILAAAVLLSIQNNNPIKNATNARKSSDVDAAQSAFNILIGKVMADCQSSVTIVPNATDNKLIGTTFTVDGTTVKYDSTLKKYSLTSGTAYSVDADSLGLSGSSDVETYTINTNGVVTDPSLATN